MFGSSRTGPSALPYPSAFLSPLSKQFSASSSSSGGAHVRWNAVGANGGEVGVVGQGELGSSNVGLCYSDAHVTSYNAAELWTFHCERVRKMPLSGLDASMLIGLPCKTEADWIYLRSRVAEVRSPHHEKKTCTNYGAVAIQESQNDILYCRRTTVMVGRR